MSESATIPQSLKKLFPASEGLKLAFEKNDRSVVHFPEDENDNDAHDPYEDDDDEFADVESLIGNIKELIINSNGSDLTSTSFRQDLHQVLNKYPLVKNSPFRASINELIVSECEKRSAVTLGESAVDKLWEEAR